MRICVAVWRDNLAANAFLVTGCNAYKPALTSVGTPSPLKNP